MTRIVVTSTDPLQHQNYVLWLQRLHPNVDIAFLEPGMPVKDALEGAQGLLLPGGGDPDPILYGKPELRPMCSIDAARDTLEFAAIRTAVDLNLPILGICRGLQIMNVALGGTLIADLPSTGQHGHHYLEGDRRHDIALVPGSLLHSISHQTQGWVNSAHHQGVDLLAPRLAISAQSHDGVAEALEWAHPKDKPFLLCVHWHPERLPVGHPLSDVIGRAFLTALS